MKMPAKKTRQRRQGPALLGYTVPEAAKAAGVGKNAMYQAIARGEYDVLRFGRKIIVPKPAFHKKFGETV
jgi:excisionase family DNA binding protein